MWLGTVGLLYGSLLAFRQPDSRGVVLGQKGVCVFPSLDRAVAFFRAYGEEGSLDELLFSAFQRFDYDFVAAILLSIIAMIMVGEVLAGWVRGVFLERGKVDAE